MPRGSMRTDSSRMGPARGPAFHFSFRALRNPVDSTQVHPPGTKGLVIFGEKNTAGLCQRK